MTDKELLELAAKAAGIKLDGMAMLPQRGWPINMESGYPWNPLTDDGDALRLAVKLRLYFSAFEGYVSISNFGRDFVLIELVSDVGDDGQILVAARKAIVRAAAEIGKAMP